MAALLLGLSAVSWFHAPNAYSDSERRALAQFPNTERDQILSGQFMSEFEVYTQDQFPMRDRFRALKSWNALFVLRQKAVNGLYLADGFVSKIEYPQNDRLMNHAAERFSYLYQTYLQGMKPYLVMVPDKNYFLAKQNGYLSMDYDKFFAEFGEKAPFLNPIDITDKLEISDYYRTDTHWKQEKIIDVARYIAAHLGISIPEDYTESTLSHPFYGVYYGQLALPLPADEIRFLRNDVIDSLKVTSFDTGMPKEVQLYNEEKGAGKDGYEFFLGGSHAVATIENAKAENSRELILFCDSFGTSIAPLLAQGYAKTTLIDIRYIPSSMLSSFVEFENQDVLFLYSTMMLNNSSGMK
ncbi:MAG: hypothetical protein E7471_05480 [Ruminococcaceae bacterium]|nr:hypothetical protein [Oscillospiraceae bacterium]